MAKVLVADDDETLLCVISDSLRDNRHVVQAVSDGQKALDYMLSEQFDVVVLDWMMPKLNGLEVLKAYRAGGGKSAIIMLSSRKEVEDKISGLISGADDYLAKPFSMAELSIRIMALLRRPPTVSANTLEKGDIVLDPLKHAVTKSGAHVHLQPMDFALLEFLMRNPSQVFSSEALLDRVWHNDSKASEEGLRMAIRRLRKALDDQESSLSIIENIKGVGYKLRD